jgi:hypothetical protein
MISFYFGDGDYSKVREVANTRILTEVRCGFPARRMLIATSFSDSSAARSTGITWIRYFNVTISSSGASPAGKFGVPGEILSFVTIAVSFRRRCSNKKRYFSRNPKPLYLRQAIPERLKMKDAGATESSPRNRLARGSSKGCRHRTPSM